MLIKWNKETAKDFINKYGSYSLEITPLSKEYNKIFMEFIAKDLPEEMNKTYLEKCQVIENKIMEISKSNKKVKQAIINTLMGFTQEMLLEILSNSNNVYLNELIIDQLRVNNLKIKGLNGPILKSGQIFQTLAELNKEQLEELLVLKETDTSININIYENENLEVEPLNPKIKEYIVKLLEGKTLSDDFEQFCNEHNLVDADHFRAYKSSILNENKMNEAQDLQNLFNNTFNLDDDSIVNNTYDDLERTGVFVTNRK